MVGFRTISRTTSNDFVHWSDPVAMSFGDARYEHLYTNQTAPYFRAPHISLAIAARFMPGRRVLTRQDADQIGVDPKYFGDCSDAVLLSTRGGSRYDRTFMESFIRPGIGLENWVSRTNYPALGILPTSDTELSIYLQKNYGQPTSNLQRYTLRIDGFASVHAGYKAGEMITKPIRFALGDKRPAPQQSQRQSASPAIDDVLEARRKLSGKCELHLNCSTSAAGSIQVELQDGNGQPVPGYSLADCDLVVGDRIDRIVTWNGNSDLRPLTARPIRFRFVMKDADLYAMQLR